MTSRRQPNAWRATQSRSSTSLAPSLSPRQFFAGTALIAIAATIAFFPALSGGFIWDDNRLIVTNKLVKAADGLPRMWFTTEPIDYWPLTNSSFWFEWRLWGAKPTGYHVTNLLLHIGAAVLVWAILRKLSIAGAFLAALLFAVHPVNVESVAWIAQRKNTLAMVFFLLSILWYLWDEEQRKTAEEKRISGGEESHGVNLGRWYWLSLLAFALAMLSKGSVAIMPVVVLLIVWWKRRWIAVWDVARSAPFFLVAAALTEVNVWFQTHGKEVVLRDVTIAERLAGAGAALWFYLSKALLPIDLAFVYPQWDIRTGNGLWWLPLLAALVVTTFLWWNRNSAKASWDRPLLFAWAFVGVACLPVLGFTDVYFMKFSLVADHYQYIALIGVAALVAAGWSVWYENSKKKVQRTALAFAVALPATLGILTWRQCRPYSDAITLFQTTLQANPDCWMAHNNLGVELFNAGRYPEAAEHYQQVLRLNPDYADAYTNLGGVLLSMGRPQEAAIYIDKALRIKPNSADARYNIGKTLADTGHPSEAIVQFELAVRMRADFAEAHIDLANALLAAGRLPEAAQHFQQAARLRPDIAELHLNFGFTLHKLGRLEEAVDQYQQSLKLKPDSAVAYNDLAMALADMGNLQKAIDNYRSALRYQPDYAEAHNNLANALMYSENPREAIAHYQQALQLKPDYVEAWMNLASAYAQTNRSAEADAAARKALALARSQGQTALVPQIESWLEAHSVEPSSSSDAARREPKPAAP